MIINPPSRPARPVPTAVAGPQATPARIALIDVDNIALGGAGVLRPQRALAHLDAVDAEVAHAELIFAVASQGFVHALGLWFRYPGWTFRPADVGPDAADHQLMGFARTALRQRPGAGVIVASGDHIFAELAGQASLRVIAPSTHRGVSARLRPWLHRIPTAPAPDSRAA